MRRLRTLPRALSDLDDIWLYIAQDNPEAAERQIDHIFYATLRLIDHPYLGPAKPNIAPDMRTLSVSHYYVLYRVTSQTIDIVRVIHQARDLSRVEWD